MQFWGKRKCTVQRETRYRETRYRERLLYIKIIQIHKFPSTLPGLYNMFVFVCILTTILQKIVFNKIKFVYKNILGVRLIQQKSDFYNCVSPSIILVQIYSALFTFKLLILAHIILLYICSNCKPLKTKKDTLSVYFQLQTIARNIEPPTNTGRAIIMPLPDS